MAKHTWKIVLVVVALLFAASIVYSQQAVKRANEGVVINSHIKGNPESSITFTEYSDFECPACGQFYPYVNEIMADYGDQIRFEYKHYPLIGIHQFAILAARASEAADQQGKFWEMHDALFENQKVWASSGAPQQYFNQYAEEIGLDVAQFKLQMSSSVIDDAVRDGYNEAQALGLRSTPTFFLNGEQMEVKSFDGFRAEVEAVLGILPETTEQATSTETETETAAQPAPEAGVKFGI